MATIVKTVKPLADHRLLLTFEDGEQRVLDVSPWLNKGVFRALHDETLFRTVRVSFDSIEWANGADLCPEVLYEESVSRNARPLARAMAVAESRVAYGKKGRKVSARRKGA